MEGHTWSVHFEKACQHLVKVKNCALYDSEIQSLQTELRKIVKYIHHKIWKGVCTAMQIVKKRWGYSQHAHQPQNGWRNEMLW